MAMQKSDELREAVLVILSNYSSSVLIQMPAIS
jgi:hypothetical protein